MKDSAHNISATKFREFCIIIYRLVSYYRYYLESSWQSPNVLWPLSLFKSCRIAHLLTVWFIGRYIAVALGSIAIWNLLGISQCIEWFQFPTSVSLWIAQTSGIQCERERLLRRPTKSTKLSNSWRTWPTPAQIWMLWMSWDPHSHKCALTSPTSRMLRTSKDTHTCGASVLELHS